MNDTLLWYTTRGAGAVTLVLLSASVVLGMEQALGMSAGHAETIDVIDDYLRRLETSLG